MKDQYRKYLLIDRISKIVEGAGGEVYASEMTQVGQQSDQRWFSTATVNVKTVWHKEAPEIDRAVEKALIETLRGAHLLRQEGLGMRMVCGNVGDFSISVWVGYTTDQEDDEGEQA